MHSLYYIPCWSIGSSTPLLKLRWEEGSKQIYVQFPMFTSSRFNLTNRYITNLHLCSTVHDINSCSILHTSPSYQHFHASVYVHICGMKLNSKHELSCDPIFQCATETVPEWPDPPSCVLVMQYVHVYVSKKVSCGSLGCFLGFYYPCKCKLWHHLLVTIAVPLPGELSMDKMDSIGFFSTQKCMLAIDPRRYM